MLLPSPPLEDQEISFLARVVWCDKAFNPNYYDIGTEFLDLSEQKQQTIKRLIDVTIYDHCWPSENQCFPMEY